MVITFQTNSGIVYINSVCVVFVNHIVAFWSNMNLFWWIFSIQSSVGGDFQQLLLMTVSSDCRTPTNVLFWFTLTQPMQFMYTVFCEKPLGCSGGNKLALKKPTQEKPTTKKLLWWSFCISDFSFWGIFLALKIYKLQCKRVLLNNAGK